MAWAIVNVQHKMESETHFPSKTLPSVARNNRFRPSLLRSKAATEGTILRT
jgi:hypothetical protein